MDEKKEYFSRNKSNMKDLMQENGSKGLLKIIFDIQGRVNFYSRLILSVLYLS